MAQVQRRQSNAIVVTFDPALCVHSARCLNGLPEVFDIAARPWIQPEHATADDVARTIRNCPSGALRYERLDGGPEEVAETPTQVGTLVNGPVTLRGDLQFRDRSGQVTRSATRATLCRCGQSSDKPFCDATHRRVGFEAD
jgi:uncharacterized Fe-S cluster protein YjdI/CDGSH-type Zn-finger protein